ncbi:monovalent cation/H+ antiporter subunit D family protein [Salinibaculum rarum]|uniref:monovalent cation/H+ antiporter subunit D family protein n=1 Tax=Salinibaculum rarum TaxID=3058903 RepID=UPI00265FEDA7|nr:monovalent cation/H+ antiporter subunit D family protein [Salinibaculum sp. KK48]
MTDAIVLAIVAPFVLAALTLIAGLRFDESGWSVALLASVLEVGLTGYVLYVVTQNGRTPYVLAGFEPPSGIGLVADGFSAMVALLVAVVSLAVVIYARRAGPRGNTFYTVYLLLVGGLAGLAYTGDLFNMYVFLEIVGLTAYALVATGDSTRSVLAGLKYLIIGTLGASLFLLGVGYAYLATGTLNMVDLASRLGTEVAPYDSRLVLASFGLIVTGLTVKVALFPMHTWQPEAYAEAPDSVSMFISALVSTVSAYALARVLFTVFTLDFFTVVPIARELITYAAAVSIVAGSVLAVMQSDIKRMLAYSSVSQFGMIVAAFGLMNETAAIGGTIHLLGHAIIKGALFGATGIVVAVTGARTVDEYAGLSQRAPVTAGAFAVLALSMVGVPPAVGFVGKWYIAVGAVESGVWPVAAVIFVSTVLTLAYFARVIERMYFAPAIPEEDLETEQDSPTDTASTAVTDGGDTAETEPTRPVSPGMVLVVVAATVTAVALGFLGSEIEQLLDPLLAEVFRQ